MLRSRRGRSPLPTNLGSRSFQPDRSDPVASASGWISHVRPQRLRRAMRRGIPTYHGHGEPQLLFQTEGCIGNLPRLLCRFQIRCAYVRAISPDISYGSGASVDGSRTVTKMPLVSSIALLSAL